MYSNCAPASSNSSYASADKGSWLSEKPWQLQQVLLWKLVSCSQTAFHASCFVFYSILCMSVDKGLVQLMYTFILIIPKFRELLIGGW